MRRAGDAANEQVLRDAVINGCFSEGCDFIINALCWEHLQAKLHDMYIQLTSFSAS